MISVNPASANHAILGRPRHGGALGDQMLPNLLNYLDLRIPRYTSYPTATQFGLEIDARSYARWLATLPAAAPVSVYVHVPFCAELCLYCGCHMTVARRYAPVEAYVELLLREIALVGRVLGGRSATHLHWGGGTPTILAPRDFRKVMAALRANFTFALAAELTIEIDPRTVTKEYVIELAEYGITRASLGVQDFNTRVQTAVNRVQSFEQTARVADWLRAAGIGSINLDLMYGLPYQNVASVETTVRRALALDEIGSCCLGMPTFHGRNAISGLSPSKCCPAATNGSHKAVPRLKCLSAPATSDRAGPLCQERRSADAAATRRPPASQLPGLYDRPVGTPSASALGNRDVAGRVRSERSERGGLSCGHRGRTACHSARVRADGRGSAPV